MDYTYKRTKITENNIRSYSDLLSTVFTNTNKFTPDFINWQYVKNPVGNVVGFDAFSGKTLVAHYATIPVSYLINGEPTLGLLSLNTAVHPNHRGKGMFTKLANKTFEEAKGLGYKFVIGVANENSTHGFLKKLDFYLVAPLQTKIGIRNISFNKNQQYTVRANHNLRYYNWRLSTPNSSYLINNNKIYSSTSTFGLYAQLCEDSLISSTTVNLKKQNPFLKILIGNGSLKKQQNLYFDLPTKLKPSPLNLIFKDLTNSLPVITSQNILFELIDFDAY